MKRRFRILLVAPEYNLDIQAQIPAAACAIHNFIRHHDPDDSDISFEMDDNADGDGDGDRDEHPGPTAVQATAAAELREATANRDRIAEAMWRDYQRILRERGSSRGLSTDNDDDDDSDGDALEDEDLL